MQPTPLKIAIAIATTVVLWASAFVAIRAALPAYGPIYLAVLRFLVASAVLAIYAPFSRMRLPERRDLPRIMLCGLVGIAGYNLALNTGEQTVTAGAASLLANTGPIWTALLAIWILGERLRVWGWVGIAISFMGAAIIAWGEQRGLGLSWGAGLVLLAAIQLSLYSVFQKPLLQRYRPVEVATYAIWAGTLLLLPFAAGLPAVVAAAPLQSTLAAIFLGIGPAALAYITWAVALAHLPAARASSFLYLVPAIALLIAWLWLGEVPGALSLIGGAFAIGGVIVVATLGGRNK
jgi:drug/metabolite transporter (DMT)-like permease